MLMCIGIIASRDNGRCKDTLSGKAGLDSRISLAGEHKIIHSSMLTTTSHLTIPATDY